MKDASLGCLNSLARRGRDPRDGAGRGRGDGMGYLREGPAVTSVGGSPMEFCVLGPVEAWADGERIRLGPAKVRCVLAVLLRTPGVLVTTEALVDRVWDEHPPGPSVRYKYV